MGIAANDPELFGYCSYESWRGTLLDLRRSVLRKR